jgi:hypothetical protein
MAELFIGMRLRGSLGRPGQAPSGGFDVGIPTFPIRIPTFPIQHRLPT